MRFRISLDLQKQPESGDSPPRRTVESEFYVQRDSDDGTFTGYSALLPGTWSQGSTLEDAIENTLLAMRGIGHAIERGYVEMPVPRTMSDVPFYGTVSEWDSIIPELGETPRRKKITGWVASRALFKLGYKMCHDVQNHNIFVSTEEPRRAISICRAAYFPDARLSKPSGFLSAVAHTFFPPSVLASDRPIVLNRTTLRGILSDAKVGFVEFWRAVAEVESEALRK